ncbi:hypothetical protein Tco_0952634 [Tanacetum coccineum]|uniref:Gag protein n=1 Tax=Tanacetum coccineum TaxID=301880 RepID=A0ABQ5E390_9ASTR
MPPRRVNHRNETPAVDLALAPAVQQAVRALLPELTSEIAASMNNANNANNPNNVNRRNERSGSNGNGGDEPATIHVWLESIFPDQSKKSMNGNTNQPAGTPEEQAKNFKWALNDIARDKLVNMEFTDVAEVANAARNIKILQKEMLASTLNDNKKRTQESEQDENEARSGKQRDNHRNEWRQNTQHGNGRDQNRYPRGSNAAYFDSAPITKCNTCGKRHPSNTCYKATGACYNCRQIGHKAIDSKGKDSTSSKGNDENNSPKTTTGGRVFAMTATQFAKP